MRTYKKVALVCLFCAILMISQIVSADEVIVDNVTYTYTVANGESKITNVVAGELADVVIPEKIEDYPVVSVGGFYPGAQNINSVVLPDTVTQLEEFAFNWCTKLKNVKLSKNLKSISHCAFTNCKGLKTINIPASVTVIDEYAFNYCESLENISLSENITSIGKGAFYACKTIKSLNFPYGLSSIGENAFFNCINLETVLIPRTVKTIGKKAFAESVRDDMGTANNFLRNRTYENICYTGTQTEWQRISIGERNGNLTNSSIKYNVPTIFVKFKNTEFGTEFTVTPENLENSMIVIAAYSDQTLKYINALTSFGGQVSLIIPAVVDYNKVKVFAFDSKTYINPLCLPIERLFVIA